VSADGAIGLMALIIFAFVRDVQASFWVIQALFAVCASVIGRLEWEIMFQLMYTLLKVCRLSASVRLRHWHRVVVRHSAAGRLHRRLHLTCVLSLLCTSTHCRRTRAAQHRAGSHIRIGIMETLPHVSVHIPLLIPHTHRFRSDNEYGRCGRLYFNNLSLSKAFSNFSQKCISENCTRTPAGLRCNASCPHLCPCCHWSWLTRTLCALSGRPSCCRALLACSLVSVVVFVNYSSPCCRHHSVAGVLCDIQSIEAACQCHRSTWTCIRTRVGADKYGEQILTHSMISTIFLRRQVINAWKRTVSLV
jgi:hypothetical protein